MPRDHFKQYMDSPSFRTKERMLKVKPYVGLEVKISDFLKKLKSKLNLHRK